MRCKNSPSTLFLLVAVAVVFCFHAGCNSRPDLRDIYDSNIKKVHVCYNIFLEKNGYKGPKDEQAFKNYLTTDPTARFLLKRLDLDPDNLEEIFVSERDGEPFVIRYGVNGLADHAIVFEQTGVDGMRYVAFANPIEIDSQSYDDHLSGKAKAENPNVAEVIKPSE